MRCTLSLGTNTLIPSRATLGFGQPHISTRHRSPHTALLAAPAEAVDGSQWMGGSLMCWGPYGAVQGAMAPPEGAQSPVAALARFSISCPLQSSADCTVVGRRLKSGLRLKS